MLNGDYCENKSPDNNTQTITSDMIKGLYLAKKSPFKYKGGIINKEIKHGFGVIYYENSVDKYIGNFYNNKSNGICRFINDNTEFTGEYIDSLPYGYGIFKSFITIKDKQYTTTTEGVWCNNVINGIAIETINDSITYEGTYVDNKKEGIGFYKWQDGTTYQGEWKDDMINGVGVIYYKDGSKYEGEVKDGYMHGYGEYTFKDGTKYIGEYVNGIKEGFGTFVWDYKNFSIYSGMWHKGKMNGIGMKISNDVKKYGVWKDGKKEKWLNGQRAVKKWMNKKINGEVDENEEESKNSSEKKEIKYDGWILKKMYDFMRKDLKKIKKFVLKK